MIYQLTTSYRCQPFSFYRKLWRLWFINCQVSEGVLTVHVMFWPGERSLTDCTGNSAWWWQSNIFLDNYIMLARGSWAAGPSWVTRRHNGSGHSSGISDCSGETEGERGGNTYTDHWEWPQSWGPDMLRSFIGTLPLTWNAPLTFMYGAFVKIHHQVAASLTELHHQIMQNIVSTKSWFVTLSLSLIWICVSRICKERFLYVGVINWILDLVTGDKKLT